MRILFLLFCFSSVALATDKPARSYRILVRLAESRAKLKEVVQVPTALSTTDATVATPTKATADCNTPTDGAPACTTNETNPAQREMIVKDHASVLLWSGTFPSGFESEAAIHATLTARNNFIDLEAKSENTAGAKVKCSANQTHFFLGTWRELCTVTSLDKSHADIKQHVFVKILPAK